MTISIIVPCRNEKAHIEGFLASLEQQALDPGYDLEVLIADGMSDDGTRELLRERAARPGAVPLRMIDNRERIVSTGLNAAILAARGSIILRMDVHTHYAGDYVRQAVRVLNETGADNVGGPWVAEGKGVVGKAIAAAFRSAFCNGGGRAHKADYEGEVDTVYLGCWTRAAFERAGLFDPDLVRNQDDELNFRLCRTGGRIWQSPRIQSSYVPRSSLRDLFRQYMQYGYWKVAVMRKHHALAAWRQAVPAAFVATLILGIVLTAVFAILGLPALAAGMAVLLGLEASAYLLANVTAALAFVKKEPLSVVLLVPIVTTVYHVAYGIGFLLGLAGGTKHTGEPELFTALTR